MLENQIRGQGKVIQTRDKKSDYKGFVYLGKNKKFTTNALIAQHMRGSPSSVTHVKHKWKRRREDQLVSTTKHVKH